MGAKRRGVGPPLEAAIGGVTVTRISRGFTARQKKDLECSPEIDRISSYEPALFKEQGRSISGER